MSYRMKHWMLLALVLGVAAIAGIVIGKAVPSNTGVENPALMGPLLLGLFGLVGAASWLLWKKTDDLQQQGQLLSWWWGGLSGSVVMLVYLLVFFGRHSDLSFGAVLLFFGQFVGFSIMWLIWRFRGRGQTE